jgi:hypothetical protein
MSNPGQAFSALAGGVVGFFIGGPAGAFAGFQYGLLAGSLLFPTQLPGVTGPRLEDFERAEADPGAAVWKCFGRVAVPGFRMYLGPVTEISNTEEVGGKGAPTQDVTTFTYTQTLALGLCEGEIPGITRIWENGKLVYDLSPQGIGESTADYDERIAASTEYQDTFTLYRGSEDQLPDPTLETELGVGNVPAFRGLAFIVWPDRLLQDDQARRHPVFKVEIGGDAETTLCAISRTTASGSHSAATSRDGGLTWTMRETPFAGDGGVQQGQWYAIAFSPSLRRLVAVGNRTTASGPKMDTMYSDDGGVTWTGVDSGINNSSNNWWSIVWVADNGGFFIAGCYSAGGGEQASTVLRTSPDGVTWTAIDLTAIDIVYVSDICYSPELQRLVAVGSISGGGIGCRIIYSNDFGVTWALSTGFVDTSPGGFGIRVTGITYDTQRAHFVYSGVQQSSSGPPNIATSPTGMHTWSNPLGGSTFPNNGDVRRVRYMPAHGRVVMICADQWGDFTSIMGAAQTPRSGHNWEGLAYDSSRERAMMIGSGTGTDSFAYREAGDSAFTLVDMPAEQAWSDVIACVSGDAGRVVSIATVVESLCAAADVTDVDVSELVEREVIGYAVTSVMSALSALNPMRMVGLFDYVESGETLRFPVRGAAAVATIPAEDLGPALAQDAKPPAITTRKLQDYELPLQIRIRYLSEARAFERGEQLSPARIGTVGVNLIDVDCPVVLDDDEAAQLAEILFREAWASRWLHSFQLDASYHALEPADCLIVPIDGRNYRVRLLRAQDSALILRKFEAVRDDDGSYTSTAIATPPNRQDSVLLLIGDTELTILDLPALQDAHDDPGFYYVVRNQGPGSAWNGAHVLRSIDAGSTYATIGGVNVEAFVGEVVSHSVGDTYTWDNDGEIVLDMIVGTLQSRTDAAVLAGANALAIGADGRWHIVQFANAELVSPGRYRLSRLLVGRRGTEHLAAGVLAGDRAVLVSGTGVYRYVLQTAEIGADRLYRPVSVGKPFSSGTDQTFAGSAEALETFSPVHVRGERDGSNNLTITWLRRDRLSQTLTDGVPVPLNEASEAYEVDILDGVDVVRTISSSVETVTYTAAQQTTDFGSAQPSIDVRIYQLSAVVGRGTPAEATL